MEKNEIKVLKSTAYILLWCCVINFFLLLFFSHYWPKNEFINKICERLHYQNTDIEPRMNLHGSFFQ